MNFIQFLDGFARSLGAHLSLLLIHALSLSQLNDKYGQKLKRIFYDPAHIQHNGMEWH